MPRATMRDVAKRAGVSTATVSLVLNKTRFVSEELTRRVTQAIEDLDYRPDAVARSLRRQSTETIGVLIPTILSPFYPAVLKAIDTAISAAGLSMLLANSKGGDESEARLISLMREKRVDGLLISPHSSSNLPQLEEMVGDNVPVVVFHRDLALGRLDCVTWKDFEGSCAAVQHLIETGRRRIAILASAPLSEYASSAIFHTVGARLRGYRAALQDAGLPFEESLYLVGPQTEVGEAVTEARAVVARALGQAAPPDAIFAVTTYLAVGALQGVQDAGLSVPEDVAVCGYDDHPWAGALAPGLSVVYRDAAMLGTVTAELLLRRLRDRSFGPPERIALPTNLIVRQSSGPASAPSMLMRNQAREAQTNGDTHSDRNPFPLSVSSGQGL